MNDNIQKALNAMLAGNRVQFADAVNAELHNRIVDAVAARREELQQTIFNGGVEEEIEPDENYIVSVEEDIELSDLDEEDIVEDRNKEGS